MEAQNTIINDIIADARAKKASDIHISEGMPIWYRVNGKLRPAEWKMTPEEVRRMLEQMMDQWHRELFEALKNHEAEKAKSLAYNHLLDSMNFQLKTSGK